MKLFYSPDYTLAAHAFETTRKSGWIAESLRAAPIPGVELVAPAPIALDALRAVHAPAYVEAVRTGEPRALANTNELEWDPGLWSMVRASNGGAVAAALAALAEGTAGSLSSGLHHARRDHGKAFCTFNGLALAARAALDAGARAVLVLDLDAHGGGGTHELLATDPRVAQLDLATDHFDVYRSVEPRFVVRRDPAGADPEVAAAFLDGGLAHLRALGFAPDLVLYNAGMDPYTHPTPWAAERERLVFDRLRGHRVAFVLAGGYVTAELDRAGLVALHRATIEAAAQRPT